MRILFVGSVIFSAKVLEHLLSLDAHVVGIATLKSSSFNSDFFSLANIAKKYSIPCQTLDDINSSQSVDWIASLRPDIIFCFGWSRLLSNEILNISPLGVVGFHPSKLPLNRGRHPLIWSLVLGLHETASTFFFMDQGADSGDILSQVTIPITYEDNAQSLYNKVVDSALEQVTDFLPKLKSRSFTVQPQDDTLSNYWRKRSFPDGIIDWRMSSLSIYNLVRGLTYPYFGAQFYYQGSEIKVWKASVSDCGNNNDEPGKILQVNPTSVIVKTGDKSIELLDTTPALNNFDFKGKYL